MRHAVVLAAALALSGCAVEAVYEPVERVRAVAWAEPGPPTLTLVTVISNRDGSGAHTGLMVSGSQRVIFDPAGTWWNRDAPERGDVKYGITPAMLDIYVDYHARPAYHVVLQELEVDAATAARAMALVEARGPVGKAACAQATSGILRELGFAGVGRTFWPKSIMRDFARIPGVTERSVFDDTEDADSPGKIYRPPAGT